MPPAAQRGHRRPPCSASWEDGVWGATEGLQPSSADVAACLVTEGAQPSFSLPSYPPVFPWYFVAFLTTVHSLWDLSSLSRDCTRALGRGSVEP